MSLLETLKQRKAKADELMLKKPFPPKQMELYQQICKKIYLLENAKMLTMTAPMSMDPQKIQEHRETSRRILSDIIGQENVDFSDLDCFVPQKVNSYREAFKACINKILIKQGGNDNA